MGLRDATLLIETKIGEFEIKPWFLEDGSLYAYCEVPKGKSIEVNRVDLRGSVRLILKDSAVGFEPLTDRGGSKGSFEYKAITASYLTRTDEFLKDASNAARIKTVKVLIEALNDLIDNKDFRQVTYDNTESDSGYRTEALEREVQELEEKLREKKKELREAKSSHGDLFRDLGL